MAFLLLGAGCGGVSNNLRPVDAGQYTSMEEDHEESVSGELNAKHLDELYAKSGIKDRNHSIEEELRKWEHQSTFDLPIHMNKQVKAYIVYFATERKGFMRSSLARSSRYLPMIKEVFQEYGLPADLAYLAMVESGFNPKARSPAGACGMWQFIKGTGLRYGLVINDNIDERQDPEKSTRAAARYLLDLYKQFGSWYLAAASYNCGERRVQKELTKSSYKNFWELSANKCIPGETRNYVPQMIAATIIARNPKKFGFTHVPFQAPVTPHTTPNIAVAQAVESPAPALTSPQPAKTAKATSAQSPVSQVSTAVPSPEKSDRQVKVIAKTAGHRIGASGRKAPEKPAIKARSAPYVASMFGSPNSPARNTEARKKSSIAHAGSKTCVTQKQSKHRPALTQKNRAKLPHLAKKQGGQKPKVSKSKARSKPKAILVSQAR